MECLIELIWKWFNKRFKKRMQRKIIENLINQLTVKIKAVK